MSRGVRRLQEEYNEIKENNALCQIGGTACPINEDFFIGKLALRALKIHLLRMVYLY